MYVNKSYLTDVSSQPPRLYTLSIFKILEVHSITMNYIKVLFTLLTYTQNFTIY